MDSQKKTTASTTKSQGAATSSRRGAEKPAATSSVARPDVREITPPTTTTAQIPTATTSTTTPSMIPIAQLEQLLRQLQPNLDMAKTLAALSQPQEITPSTPIAQPTPSTPLIGTGEEWFDAEGGGATPVVGQEAEEVYSGATVDLGMDEGKEVDDDAGSKPQEVEQPIEAEAVEEEVGDLAEGRIEDVVIVPDDDEEDQEDREETEKEVVGQGEGQSENAPGASRRRRRLLIEEDPMEEEADEEADEDIIFQPLEEIQLQRQLEMPVLESAQRKRKGKQIAQPAKKKSRPASTSVRIQEPRSERAVAPQEEESDEDDAPRWERRTKRRQEEVAPAYSKVPVRISKYSLDQMVKFTDDRWEEECKKRVTTTKLPKSGKKLHQPSLADLGAEEEFIQYITGIGFEWLMELDMPKVPQAMAKEFFTSFRFKTSVTDLSEESISFRLCNQEWRMDLTEWSVRLGLYTVEQAVNGDWFGRDIGFPKNNPDFNPQKAWKSICHEGAPLFKPTVARGIHIADPILRLAQVFLGYNVLGQANTSSSITQAELYFMWCMKEQRKVHLGYWIAWTCHQIATHAARHLNVCHLLGAFVKNNLDLEIDHGLTPRMCPMPESFNKRFFMNVKILKERRGRLYYYDVGQPDLQLAPLDEPRTDERRKAGEDVAQPTVHTRRQLVLAEPRNEEEEAAPKDDWKGRTERLLQQLVQNTEAQRQLMEVQAAQMTRAVEVMEQMLSAVREGPVIQQQQETPSLPTQAQGSQRAKPAKDTDPKQYHRKR